MKHTSYLNFSVLANMYFQLHNVRSIDDAVANGFSGYALDMVCGGQDEPERAVFLSEFITRAREKIPGFTVSWWTHYS